jgi:hypothetical protein
MNKQQALHVGMINSFNLITGRTTLDEVVHSGIGVFAHVPDEEVDMENIKLIIIYFQDRDMFEHCIELVDYLNENFNKDGTSKEEDCSCEFPEIKTYSSKMKCSTCNKRLRK